MPEARYALAQAAIYLALAPKSDAAGRALSAAERHVREHGAGAVPGWLRPGRAPGTGDRRLREPARPPGASLRAGADAAERCGRRFYAPAETEPEAGRAARADPPRARVAERARARMSGVDEHVHGERALEARRARTCSRGTRRRARCSAPSRSRRRSRSPASRWTSPRCSRCGRCCASKDRARYMRRMAQAVIDDFEELSVLLAREQGRPRGGDRRARAAAGDRRADLDRRRRGQGARQPAGGHQPHLAAIAKRARVAYEPYGVIGVIGAGCAPFAQPLGQIAGALLAGNGVAFKPAPARASPASGSRACSRGPACPRGSCASCTAARRRASPSRAHRSTRSSSPARRPSGARSRGRASRERRR